MAMNKLQALVVDDDRSVRELTAELLILWGYDVRMAGDGEEAMLFLREAPQTALVVTDYRMPNMNGVELTKRIKQIAPGIKVIVVSGDDPNEIGESVRAAGADAPLLRKPFNMDQLWASIVSAFP